MMNSICMAEKPVAHISTPDWKGKIWNMRAAAETKAANSCELRNEDRMTRNEAVISSKWATYHNNLRISDRLTELRRWLNILNGAMENMKLQSELLLAEKNNAEQEIDKYSSCLNALAQCRLLRDQKHKINLCYDGVFDEVKREIDLLEGMKRYLSTKCFSAWEQNNRLRELIFKVESDVADKREAMDIDVAVLKLEKTNASTSFKPDVLRVPDTVVPYETWLEQARFNQVSADNESLTAAKLREALALTREKCRVDFLAQFEATNFQMRRKIYETNRLKTELEWQKKNMLAEMEKLQKELDRMVKTKEDTINMLKCAESRLEARNQRPSYEQARDEPQVGLYDEVLSLRQTLDDLNKKISETRATYNKMESYVLEFDNEIKYKDQSLKLDNDAMELHKSLLQTIPISQVDRNIQLLNMSKELPPEQPVILK